MEIFAIDGNHVTLLTDPAGRTPATGFLWIDSTHEEVTADANAWRERIEALTGVQIYDLHLRDAVNSSHPSYFDSTRDYAMVVFRKLALVLPQTIEAGQSPEELSLQRQGGDGLLPIKTQPVTFLLLDRALVTVHASGSRTIEATRQRLLEYRSRPDGNGYRLPSSSEDLVLRLLNAMVDQYLALRQPLTERFENWQRGLLDPRRPFREWNALLDTRIELRRLDNLCEEQRDALQEFRDYLIDTNGSDSRIGDLLLVKVNDVMEHITRVLNHARRLESSLESAVQIHFSAMAHRTNEVVRTLTVITALFMPLTLLTGIFGMNFESMPLVGHPTGFWLTMAAMLLIVLALLLVFRRRRYLEHRALSGRR